MIRNIRTFKLCFLLFVLFIVSGCQEKNSKVTTIEIDKERLKIELDTIFKMDQKYRSMMGDTSAKYGWNSPPMDSLWKKQSKIDSANLKKVLQILEKIKVYPGDSIVGYPTRKAAFYVLQHAPDSIQETHLAMILDAAKNGELDKNLAAMYHDRYLLHRGLPQIYGSQIRINRNVDSVTGKETVTQELYKIKDTARVDSLRKSMGMIPLKKYLQLYD